MRVLSSLLVLCALAFVSHAQVPIPNRPDGYALSLTAPATAPVVLEAFFDLLCPDSKAAWPVVKQLLEHYPQSVYFLMHTFPLPYHTFSFLANEGAHVMDALTGGNTTAVRAYTDLLFDVQEAYYNPVTLNQSTTQVVERLAKDVQSVYPDNGAFLKRMNSPGDINGETRISWKYGCSRAITGTPTFLLNGVYIDADASWALSDWQSVIDPLLKHAAARAARSAHRAVAQSATEPAAVLSAVLSKVLPQLPRQNETCVNNQTVCDYSPNKFECCLTGEECIPNVGCRCLTDSC